MPLKRSLWPAQHQRLKLHYVHLHPGWRPFKILPAAKLKKKCVQVLGCMTAQRCMRFRTEPADKTPSNKTWDDCAYTCHRLWIAAPPHREAVLPEIQSQGLSTFLFSWTSLKGWLLSIGHQLQQVATEGVESLSKEDARIRVWQHSRSRGTALQINS